METAKTILAMVGLVLIGFVAGFFLQKQMTTQHFKRIKNMGTPQGLQEELFEYIQADEAQIKVLRPRIQPHIEHLKNAHYIFRKDRAIAIDSLKSAINPEITAKQQKKLERFTKRLENRFRKKKGFKGKKKKKDLSKE